LRLSLWTLQEPEVARPEYQDNSDIYCQPLPKLVPEEEDVHADHDSYHREHVQHDGCLSAHRLVLLCATEWSKRAQPGPFVPPRCAADVQAQRGRCREAEAHRGHGCEYLAHVLSAWWGAQAGGKVVAWPSSFMGTQTPTNS